MPFIRIWKGVRRGSFSPGTPDQPEVVLRILCEQFFVHHNEHSRRVEQQRVDECDYIIDAELFTAII